MVYSNPYNLGCWILSNILIYIILFSPAVLSGCSSRVPSISLYKFIPKKGIKNPDPNYYLILPSDTLIAIAMHLDLDYKLLAQYNNLKEPYVISAGEYIRITKPMITYVTKTNKVIHKQKSSTWIWPVHGKIHGQFYNKGIDIISDRNSAIKAVQDGEVVYSGNSLKGYGNLIILKHNNNFLSAYAHNEELLANEGDIVSQGTLIARMGNSGSKRVMLHFEIRKNGNPVNPLIYLPN